VRLTLDDPPFAGRTGQGVVVAVLDSGIHAEHPHVMGISGGISLCAEVDDVVDRIGHGTAVAAAIRDHAPATTLLAVKVFDRALELSNCNIFVLCWNAAILAWTGKTELAIERAQLALRLGPFDSLRWRANHALAIAYFHSQKYADAAEAARNAIDGNPVYSIPRAFLTAALVRLGRMEEAKAMAKTVLECDPSFTIRGTSLYSELEPAVFRPMADAWRE